MQSAIAPSPPPTVTFTSASYPGGSFSNGDGIPMSQGQSRMTITISFQGTDTNDDMRRLECRWSGGNIATPTSLSSSNCNLYQMVSGRTATSRVEREVAVSSNAYVLEVRGVDASGTAGNIYRFTFTVTPPALTISDTRPTVTITGTSPTVNSVGNTNTITIPPDQYSVTVTVNFIGSEGNDFIRAFRCTLNGSPLSCAAWMNDPASSIVSGTNPPETRNKVGNVAIPYLPPEDYTFTVTSINQRDPMTSRVDERESLPASLRFTVTQQTSAATPATPTPPPIDGTLRPEARIFKAISHRDIQPVNPSVNNPGIHLTPYNNMYIVFQAYYGGRSDIYEGGVRTTFECLWDGIGNPRPCGRSNILRDLAPGEHTVEYRAINGNGGAGPWHYFYWCISSSATTCSYNPLAVSPIRWFNVISFIPELDVSYYSGKNETISLKDLKAFPIPFLNKTIGTNNTNVTSLGIEDSLVAEPGKESPVEDKSIGSYIQGDDNVDDASKGTIGGDADTSTSKEEGTGAGVDDKQAVTESETSKKIECPPGQTYFEGEGCGPG